MAFKKKSTTEKEVFALTLPLRHEPWQRDVLDKLFWCCNQCKNALISRKLKAWKQLSQTRQWRYFQNQLNELYNVLNKIDKDTHPKEHKTQMDKIRAVCKSRNDLLKDAGFTMYAFEHDIGPIYKHFGKSINVSVAQKIADNVWKSFESVIFKAGNEVSFSSIADFRYLEAKSNASGFVYDSGFLYLGGKVRYRMKLPVCLNRCDTYGYEEQALQRNVHFCGIERRPYPDGWHYFAVLHLGGTPPMKVKKETGELLHSLGHGRVGHDIGTQTLASVGDNDACLVVLAEQTQSIEDELRRINRAMDRSRRSANPDMFNEKGIVPITRLPSECVINVRGTPRRKWTKSKRYKALERKRLALYARQKECRKRQHNELANKLLAFGDEHYIEKMNFAALSKKNKNSENSKSKCRKRFGKSISNKAPAVFVDILEKKVVSQGGTFQRIDTFNAKASQYNHQEKAYKKKHLGQRWNHMPDGHKIQRDLYSAFCIQNTNSTFDGFKQDLLETKYSRFLELHESAIETAKIKQYIPSSMGI